MKINCAHHELVELHKLQPNPKNPNKHPDRQIDMLAKIIDYQGQRSPIVVSKRSGFITKGHGRLMAIKKLGWDKAAVDYQEYESEAMEMADMVADNKIAELAETDTEMLQELGELLGDDFDNELLGLEEPLVLSDEERDATEDEVPEVTKTISKLGDLYEIGGHRLLCGDSTDKVTVERLMNGEKADMVFTDPPYCIETDGGFKGEIGKSLRKQGQSIEFIADFNPAKFLSVIPDVFEKNKMNAYVFCNKELLPDYLNWAVSSKFSFNVLIWKKPNAIPIGDSHRPDIEYMLLFRKSAIWNNGIEGVNYSRCLDYGRETGLHPTMKPVGLIENEMKISSNVGSPVLDLFGGSGSTLIACEKTNRKCFMMELDPHYVDVIVSRWCKYTGKYKVKRNGEEIDWPTSL